MISERLLIVLAQFEIKIWYFSLHQAELVYAVCTIVCWGVANNFQADGGVQSGVITSPKYILIIRWRLLYVSV